MSANADPHVPPAPDVAPTGGFAHHRGLDFPFAGRVPAPGEVVAVAPGIGWLRHPLPIGIDHVNAWAIDDEDGALTIVDTGMGSTECRDGWKAALAGPLDGRRVARVIGTHFHADHVGLAGWLCRRDGAMLWMTRGEWLTLRLGTTDARDAPPDEAVAFWRGAGWSDDQIAAAAARGWGWMARVVSRLPYGYRRIVDGEVIAIGGHAWRVVVGSGHSPEHACLYDSARGIFIAGDQVLPRISPNVSLGPTEPDADPLGEWLASIAKLRREVAGDVLVLPSHGEPFHGLHTRLDALDREHRKRLDLLHAHLAEPRRAVDCFGRMFRRAIGADAIGLATGETLAHLRHLEVEGRAVRTVEDGVWWYRAA